MAWLDSKYNNKQKLLAVSCSTVREELCVHTNNCLDAKWTPRYVEVYMQPSSCFKVWLKESFFDKKPSHLSNILLLIASVFTFSYDKNIRATST